MPRICVLVAACGRRTAAALLLASLSGEALAVDRTWIAGTSLNRTGNWSIASNWSPTGIPVSSDNVFLFAGGTIDSVISYDYGGIAMTLSTVTVDNTGPALAGAFTVLSIPGGFPFRRLSANIEYVGVNGRGRVNQGGGSNATEYLFLGHNAGAQGVYSLGGASALSTLFTYVGYSGSGSFSASSFSSHTQNGDLYIAYNAGSAGVYNLSGSALLNAASSVYVGIDGNGTLNQSGGSLTLNGSRLGVGWSTGSGVYAMSGGNLTLAGAAPIEVGHGGVGTMTQSGESSVALVGAVLVGTLEGASGAYAVADNAALSCRDITIGDAGRGMFTQTGGSVVTRVGITLGNAATGAGTLTVAGGSMYVGLPTSPATQFYVGVAGTGAVVHSAGSVSTGDTAFVHLRLGLSPGSRGSYAISGTGVLTVNGSIFVGDAGEGAFSVTGGSVLATAGPNLNALELASGIFSSATFLLAGDGSFEARGAERIGIAGPAAFTQTGGLNYLANTNLYLGYFASSPATYHLSGGLLFASHTGFEVVGDLGPALFIQTGGTNTIKGANGLTLALGAGSSGTYSLSGGTLTTALVTAKTNGHFVYTGGALSVSALKLLGGTASFGVAGATRLTSLSFAGSTDAWSGQLDLHAGALILQAASPADKVTRVADLRNQILTGRNGGAWNGQGITSSTIPTTPNTTLALADNGDLHFTSFRGTPLDDNALIIVRALIGDANLDAKVDAFDLNLLASSWQQLPDALWSDGDFNADGIVDAFDLNLLAANWQAGAAALLPDAAGLPAGPWNAVPEPGTLAIVGGAAALLTLRRGGRRTAQRR